MRDFRAADDRARSVSGMKMPELPIDVVIQEIARAGVERVHVERPPCSGNAQPDVVLNISLALQRNEAIPLRNRKLERRAGEAVERRRLVVIRIVTVQRPVQTGNANGRAESRIGGVLIHQPRVMRQAEAQGRM